MLGSLRPDHIAMRFAPSSALAAGLLATLCCAAPALAQNGQKPNAAAPPPAAQKKVSPLSTTVVVRATPSSDYLPQSVSVGTIDGLPLQNAPLSATVMTRDLMTNQVARLLSDVVQNDASVEDDYVPVGYYGDYQIRGYQVDLATGLEINGMTIAGEQDVPLENKERVEILNGLGGVTSGVASGAGLINYVTKSPAAVRDFELSTDQYGTAYGAADLGRFFGSRKQFGVRANLAGEHIETYMNDTQGWRALGATEMDWKISPQATLAGNFEYQHKVERDGSGYQLLGGTTLPDIHRIYRSTMLGEQPWAPPDTYDTFNTGVRLNFTLSPAWTGFAAASLSHSLIDDNVIYAYGAAIDPNTYAAACPNAPYAPAYFFCPDGTYGIYDYRNPNELRTDSEAEAMITGQVKTAAVTQVLTFGGEIFKRNVQMPGFYSFDNPYSPDGIVQDGAVYSYLGPENIYQPMIEYPIESPVQQAGPRRLYINSHQASAVVQDRIQLPGRIQLIAGGRYDMLHDHNYSAVATTPCVPSNTPRPPNDPCPTTYDNLGNPIYAVPNTPVLTDKPVWMPQYAVTFNPRQSITLYANYGVMLSLGPQAPWWADNGSQFLDPYNTRQFEAGAKYEPGQRILIAADYFFMRAPFFYPKILTAQVLTTPDTTCPSGAPGDLCFVSQGRETHDGVELNAQGEAASWLRLNASLAGIHAISQNTGTPAYDNQQVINVPRFHSVVFADVSLRRFAGLYLMPGWSFTGRKQALPDDSVSVPSYNLFNLGLRYTPGGEQGRITFRAYSTNITNKKYWSDTGASYGDTFVWLGAPTLVRISAQYRF